MLIICGEVNKMSGFEKIKRECGDDPQETYRNILRNMPGSHIRELNKDCMLSYREQLAKLYFEIEAITEKMDTCLKMTQEHPVEISKSDSVDVSIFISEIDVLVKDSFELFVGMSEQ